MDKETQNLSAALDKAVQILGEHADAVVILAMYTAPDGSDQKCVAGSGSSYTRHSMITEEYLRWREYVKTHARHMQNKNYQEPPEE